MSRQLVKANKKTQKAVSLFTNVRNQLVSAQEQYDRADKTHREEIARLEAELARKISAHHEVVSTHNETLKTVAVNREANQRVLDKVSELLPVA